MGYETLSDSVKELLQAWSNLHDITIEEFIKIADALASLGEVYPMTSEEIRLALDESDDCYTDALNSIFEEKGRYQIEFD